MTANRHHRRRAHHGRRPRHRRRVLRPASPAPPARQGLQRAPHRSRQRRRRHLVLEQLSRRTGVISRAWSTDAFDDELEQEWEWPERFAAQPESLATCSTSPTASTCAATSPLGQRVEALRLRRAERDLVGDHRKRCALAGPLPHPRAVGFLSTPYCAARSRGWTPSPAVSCTPSQWPESGPGRQRQARGHRRDRLQRRPADPPARGSRPTPSPSCSAARCGWCRCRTCRCPPEYQERIKARYSELRRRELDESFAGQPPGGLRACGPRTRALRSPVTRGGARGRVRLPVERRRPSPGTRASPTCCSTRWPTTPSASTSSAGSGHSWTTRRPRTS